MALLESKRFRLKDIHEEKGIPLDSLSSYFSGRVKIKNVAWKTVLSQMTLSHAVANKKDIDR